MRKIGDAILTKPVDRLIKRFPKITADAVTKTGLGLTLIGSAVKALPETITSGVDTSLIALGLMAAGAILDGLDGKIARTKGESTINGALTDVVSDRLGESGMAASRIIQAAARRDRLGIVTATLAGITGPLPSLFRAKVEEKGYFVPESGKNPATVLGARLPRVIFGTAATVYPTALDLPIQVGLDSVTTASNIALTFERLNIFLQAKRGQLTENPDLLAQELGKKKAEVLTKLVVFNGVGMVAIGATALFASFNQ